MCVGGGRVRVCVRDLVLGGVFQRVAGVTSSAASRKAGCVMSGWRLSCLHIFERQSLETQKVLKRSILSVFILIDVRFEIK